jgi:hypothetical protein
MSYRCYGEMLPALPACLSMPCVRFSPTSPEIFRNSPDTHLSGSLALWRPGHSASCCRPTWSVLSLEPGAIWAWYTPEDLDHYHELGRIEPQTLLRGRSSEVTKAVRRSGTMHGALFDGAS